MKVPRRLKRALLKVFSSVSANLSIIWIGSSFATRSTLTLLTSIILGIICLYLATKAEEFLESDQ